MSPVSALGRLMRHPLLAKYGSAVLLSAAAFGLAWILPAENPYVIFFAAVALAAWYGGLGPVLIVTTSAIAATVWFARAAGRTPDADLEDLVQILVFVLVAALISSLAAARRRTEAALQARIREQAAVAELGQRALGGADLGTLMTLAARRVADAMAVDCVGVFETTRGSDELRLAAGVGWPEGQIGPATVPTGFDSQAGYALATRAPVIVEDLRRDRRFTAPPLLQQHRLAGGVVVVIEATDAPFGVLAAHTIRRRPFTTEHVYFLQAVANVLSDAIRRQEADERLRVQLDQLQVIYHLSATLGRAQALDEIYSETFESLRRTVGAERAAILLGDRDEVMRFHAWIGLSEAYRRAVEGHSPWPPEGPFDPILAADVEQAPLAENLRAVILREGIRAVGFVPLISRDRLIGKLMIYYDSPRQFRHEEIRLAATIASHVAYAVERRRVEEAIRQSEEELRFALRAAGMEAWDWDVPGGEMRWSDGLEAAAGIASRYRGPFDAYLRNVHPDDREMVERSLRAALARGDEYQLEYRITRAGEGVRWIEAKGRVFADERGEPVRMAGVAVDITDRKRSEQERNRLLAAEQAARADAETAQRRATLLSEASAVLGASLDYEQTLTNLAQLAVPDFADWCAVDIVEEGREIRRLAVAHVDWAKNEWARELHRRYPPDPDAPFGVPKVLRTGQSEFYPDVTDDILAKAARDPEHLAMLRAVGVRSAMIVPLVARRRTLGALTFATAESGRRYTAHDLVMAEDLARRAALAVDNARLYREAQDASRAKDEFLATVSHELRTPLNAILGWASLLRSGALDTPGARRALETIERNARAQAQLVSDVLDVSRIITGKLGLDVRPVDLAPVVEAAIDSVRPAAAAKGIELVSELDPEAGQAWGDPDRLQQVAWNLLANAIKFTPREGRVHVFLTHRDGAIEMGVRDTGQGIKPEFLPFVFDRFRQADASSTRRHGGLGLGLAIVRHLVELHGGTVWAQSPGEGKGATFYVRLPLMPAQLQPEPEAPLAAAAEPRRASTAGALRGLKVLAVDDERDTRELVAVMLAGCGADVQTAASADEGFDIYRRWRPDVLLLDLEMPGEDGYALLRRIRSAEDPERAVTAIALTAHARSVDRARALEAGFQMHLAKPIGPDELVLALASVAPQQATRSEPLA